MKLIRDEVLLIPDFFQSFFQSLFDVISEKVEYVLALSVFSLLPVNF